MDRDAAWDNYWGRRESVVQKEPALHVPDQRLQREKTWQANNPSWSPYPDSRPRSELNGR